MTMLRMNNLASASISVMVVVLKLAELDIESVNRLEIEAELGSLHILPVIKL